MASNVNSYATLTELKSVLGVTSVADDAMMRKIIEASSRAIESYTNRRFYVTSETKYFDGAGAELWIPDLLSVDASGLKTDEDGDAVFENTFASSDYLLYGAGSDDALNLFPKIRIELTHDSNYGSFASGVRKGVQIAGVWGYGDGTSATPYVADTTTAEALDAGETAIDVTSATNLSIGMTLLLVDADTGKTNEQMYITAISSNTVTAERGVNGTTDQGHATAKQLYYYRYPRDITQTCIDLSVALYQFRGKRGIQSERTGDYSYSMQREMITQILGDSIKSYRRLRI